MNFNACQILLLVIGEESKKISDDLKAAPNNGYSAIALVGALMKCKAPN